MKVDSAGYDDLICRTKQDTFSYTLQRDGVGYFTITQPYGSDMVAEPIGFLFGKGANGKKVFCDFEQHKMVLSFSFTNTSTYDLQVGVVLVDTLGNEANAMGTGEDESELLRDYFYSYVWKGRTKSYTITWDEDCYKIVVSKEELERCETIAPTLSKDQSFNKKAVGGILLRVTNVSGPGAFDTYKRYSLRSAIFQVDDIILKEAVVANIDEESLTHQVSVGPNPTKGSLHFSQALNAVKLLDMMGNVLCTVPSAASLEISHLNAGIYLLAASELRQPLKIVKE